MVSVRVRASVWLCLPSSSPPPHVPPLHASRLHTPRGTRTAANASRHPASTIVSLIVMGVFVADMLVSFFVGYFDGAGALVADPRRVAWNYFT